MSLVAAAALAASTVTVPACSWDRPGVDPYRGDMAAAVDRYTDIPEDVRAVLRQRVVERRYDDIAAIYRDRIEGSHEYSGLRQMHFGQYRVCGTVTRGKWAPDAVERGLVYCERGHCLIVPTVCRNVSRIDRGAPTAPAAASAGGGSAAGDELAFDPPGAGRPPAEPASAMRAQPTPVSGPASFSQLALPGWIGGGWGGSEQPAIEAQTPMAPIWGAGPGPIGREHIGVSGATPLGPISPAVPPLGNGGLPPTPAPGLGPITPVPEPGSALLLLAGGVVLLAAAKRRR